ncbi:alpha-ketoglutarate-dependent dioxygenase AlkB family protein [Phytohalomonas tamaricis]|uniref:alpha-ketoglutarate-dependent dioxygenase AlkB family protein n=1 Tax=Phytohalomonas tamaricis TaxID=2081032 RepID=UPI000D0AEF19|nr:alpha-ketoglutarate-dependent dioxygenase AlkB [Phytohalomonas tamaricis]
MSLDEHLPNWLRVHPDYVLWRQDNFLSAREANLLFDTLEHDLEWQRPTLTLYGKQHLIPRSQVWMGDADAHYRYSATSFEPVPWHHDVTALCTAIQAHLKTLLGPLPRFNSVLINRYANGDQRMGWHSDDEPELGSNPIIASVSLGTERPMRFRPRKNRSGDAFNVALPHGSLLIMGHDTQRQLQHALLPRRLEGSRINLTFRAIHV